MLKRNLIANFAGTLWSAALSFALIPFYVRRLGIEAYGIVGFAVALQALLSIFDLGLSTSLNRELARSAGDGTGGAHRLVRTLELVYWSVGVAIAVALFAAAPWIGARWFAQERIATATIVNALRFLAIVMAVQFPYALYSGGLLGLQRHARLNALIVAGATLRTVGAAAALVIFPPTLEVFFAVQAIAYLLQTAAAAVMLRHALGPATGRIGPGWEALRPVWRFAAGITVLTVLGAFLSQVDKLVLSRVLPLESFGYYALATNAAASVALISAPFFATAFPRFSSLVAAGDEPALRVVYHQACQLLSVILLPLTGALIVFARQVLLVWTGNHAIAENAALPMALLAAGFALNALNNLPHALQLAHGWTTLAVTENSIAVAVLIPLAIYAGRNYGAAGAAAVWMLLNVFYATIAVWIMHRRYLRGELLHWYRYDVGAPLLATIIVLVPAAFVAPATGSRIVLFLWLAVTTTGAAALAVLLTPHPRAVAKDYWSQLLAGLRR